MGPKASVMDDSDVWLGCDPSPRESIDEQVSCGDLFEQRQYINFGAVRAAFLWEFIKIEIKLINKQLTVDRFEPTMQ